MIISNKQTGVFKKIDMVHGQEYLGKESRKSLMVQNTFQTLERKEGKAYRHFINRAEEGPKMGSHQN